jgi:hypothetical protein
MVLIGPRVRVFRALVRLNILRPALWAPIIATTTPDISPLLSIIWAAIIINELLLGHSYLLTKASRRLCSTWLTMI